MTNSDWPKTGYYVNPNHHYEDRAPETFEDHRKIAMDLLQRADNGDGALRIAAVQVHATLAVAIATNAVAMARYV